MQTRIVSLNHPSVRPERLYRKRAVHTLPDGTKVVGVLAPSADGRGLVHLSGDGVCYRVGPLVTLVVEDQPKEPARK